MTRMTFLAALAGLLSSTAALAASDLPVRAELLPGWREGAQHIAGLRLVLEPGWKTYWRAPGDAGIPPEFDWAGSKNLGSVRVDYPVPAIYDVSGVRTIGYADEVVFPLTLTATDPARPIELSAGVQLGVCQDVCIPVTFRISGTLPTDGAHDARVARARADRPTAGGAMTCRITPISDGLRLEVAFAMPSMPGPAETVIETADPSVWVSAPEVSVSGGMAQASADLVPPDAVPFALERDGLRLTVIGGGRAVELKGCD